MRAPHTNLHGPEAPRLDEIAFSLAMTGEDKNSDTTAASSQGDVPTTRPRITARPKQGLPWVPTSLAISLAPHTNLHGPEAPRLDELAVSLAMTGEDKSSDTTAASSQGDVPTTRPHVTARPKQGLPRVATSAHIGPQGGMRATSTTAASVMHQTVL